MKMYDAERLHWLRHHRPTTRAEFLDIANHSGTIPTEFPRAVHLEVGATCNLNCTFCSKPTRRPVTRIMDAPLLARIVSECAREGVYRLDLHFFNEPLLHIKSLLPVITQAKAEGIPIVAVTTNITPLTEQVMGQLIDARLDTLHLSFEGANAQTYEARRGVKASVIAKRIEGAVGVRQQRNVRGPDGRLLPWMAITMVRTTETEEECEAFRKVWAGRVDYVDIREMIGSLGRTELKMGRQMPVRIPCRFVGDRLAIAADGMVTACAIDVDTELALGDLWTGQTIKEIWNSDRYRAFWALHQWGRWDELPSPCRTCDSWELHSTWRGREKNNVTAASKELNDKLGVESA